MSYIFSFLTKSYFIRAGVLLSMLCYRLIESIVLALDVSIGAEYSKGRPPMNFHLHLLWILWKLCHFGLDAAEISTRVASWHPLTKRREIEWLHTQDNIKKHRNPWNLQSGPRCPQIKAKEEINKSKTIVLITEI